MEGTKYQVKVNNTLSEASIVKIGLKQCQNLEQEQFYYIT